MKFFAAALATIMVGASASPAELNPRGVSKSWGGTSNYFVQAMADDQQEKYIKALTDAGVRVLRVWVNAHPGNNACTKGSRLVKQVPDFEETIGKYNWETLDVLDKTLTLVEKYGMKALISPHDANALHGANGNDIYGQTWGAGYFYEKQDAITAFEARLKAIITYKGKYSGKVWRDWSSTIMAFDIENEPFSSKTEECQYSSAEPWVCGRSKTMRGLLGSGNQIKIATGGFGGDITKDCTFRAGATTCPDVDIVSVHRYAGPESSNPNQWANSYNGWLKQTNGKLVFVEEWGINGTSQNQGSEFPANTKDMNNAGLPWLYWQILPEKVCDVNDGDPFGIYVNQGVNLAGPLKDARNANSKQDWSGVVW